MSMLTRSIAAVAVSSFAVFTGCAAPVGEPPAGDRAAGTEEAEGEAKDLLTGPGMRLWTKPTYYTAVAGGGNVDMGPASSQFCTLTGVEGGFFSQSSTAFIWVLEGHYWLEANDIELATAACAPWSDFTGPGTSSYTSTVNAPWYAMAGGAYGDPTQVDMGPTGGNYCLLAGIAGDWYQGSPSSNSVLIEQNIGVTTSSGWQLSNVMKLSTGGSFARTNANCLSFATNGHPLNTPTVTAVNPGDPSAELPPVSQALCGIIGITGNFESYTDSVVYWADSASNSQGFGITGNVKQAIFGCVDYVQPE